MKKINLNKITINDVLKSVGRELGMRKSVYPKWIKSGKLTEDKAAHEIACMEKLYEFLKDPALGPHKELKLLDLFNILSDFICWLVFELKKDPRKFDIPQDDTGFTHDVVTQYLDSKRKQEQE